MKNNIHFLIAITMLAFLSSCTDKYTETFTANVPEYMSLDDWRSIEITASSPRELAEPGKIYIYENYLFVVERGFGIHILDNSNPASPQNIAFLSVAGCVDLAVRNDLLYVDSYYDLLAFDIGDPTNPTLSCRTVDAFDFDNWTMVSGYDEDLPFEVVNRSQGVVVGWSQKEIDIEAEGYSSVRYNEFTLNDALINVGSSVGSTGQGGSMAQFTITGSNLYVLRPNTITTFSLNNDCPQELSETPLVWNAETIFPYNNHLFLGTSSGMLIYSLTNPSMPEFVSSISHLTACDPVAVQGDRAYVTIRTGTQCQGFLNQLIVVDIADYSNPVELATYNLTNPHGLGIDGTTLFICDGSDGLKVYNAEDDLAIAGNRIAHYENINSFDVIPFNNVLIMSATEGIYQYDYSDPLDITQLSFIPSY